MRMMWSRFYLNSLRPQPTQAPARLVVMHTAAVPQGQERTSTRPALPASSLLPGCTRHTACNTATVTRESVPCHLPALSCCAAWVRPADTLHTSFRLSCISYSVQHITCYRVHACRCRCSTAGRLQHTTAWLALPEHRQRMHRGGESQAPYARRGTWGARCHRPLRHHGSQGDHICGRAQTASGSAVGLQAV